MFAFVTKSKTPLPPCSANVIYGRPLAPSSPCNCPIHQADLQCNTRNVIYQATCQHCQGRYIGATARPLVHRISEHEASTRLGNSRSTLGEHIRSAHPHVPTGTRGVRDYEQFFRNFDFKIIGKGRDALGTFLRENQLIIDVQPELNIMKSNGFVF